MACSPFFHCKLGGSAGGQLIRFSADKVEYPFVATWLRPLPDSMQVYNVIRMGQALILLAASCCCTPALQVVLCVHGPFGRASCGSLRFCFASCKDSFELAACSILGM